MTTSIYTNEMLALQDWLRTSRKSQGLTMRELGDKLGKPHSFVQKIESGERRLDVVELVWYCTALGIDPRKAITVIEKA